MIQPKKFDIENMTIHFRWLLPVMGSVFLFFYNRDIQWQKDNFDEIKNSQKEIRIELKEINKGLQVQIDSIREMQEDRLSWVYRNCCSDEKHTTQ